MRRPLVALALIFSLGILVASKIRISLISLYFISIILLIFCFLSFKRWLMFDIFLFFLTFTLGIVLLKNSQNLPKCHILRYICYKNNQPYIIKGYIDNQPISKNDKTSFIFKCQEIQTNNVNHACCGNIFVHLKGKKDLHYGDELILKGNLYKPFNKKDSCRQSYRNYLYNHKIWFIMSTKTEADVIKLNNNKGFTLKRFALGLKNKMEEIIFRNTSALTAAILDAMILGEKRNIPWFVNNSMMKSGTIHILVVSGFNVGIVIFIVILFLKLLRLSRKIRCAIAILCLIVYCFMTGASTPVLRATVMAIVFMLAYLIKRQPDIYNSCALASIFILMANPLQLFDIGFQLSFASVLSIVYLYPKIKSLLRIDSFKIRFIRLLLNGCLVSLSCWLGTVGIIAYYFKIFSSITVLANIFIVPLATLITLCGFSLILVSLVFPVFALFFALACELIVAILLNVNTLLIKIPGAYFYLP